MKTQYRYIFISPEMISLPYILDKLQRMEISLFVIDEAHCISQWGYDFRPDYQKLGYIRQKLNNPLTLALTATATEEIRKDVETRVEKAIIFARQASEPDVAEAFRNVFSS